MPDQGKLCVCPQCGKKYALKEGFDAKSFSCKGCGATVWVSGKPPAPVSSSKGSAPTPRAAVKGGRGGRPAAASRGAGRRSRDRGGEEEAEGGRRGRAGREKPKNNTNLILAVVGLVMVVGLVLFFTLGGKDKGGGQEVAKGQPGATTGTETPLAPGGTEPGAQPAGTEPSGAQPTAGSPAGSQPTNPTPAGGDTAKPTTPEEAPPAEGGGETVKPKLGDKKDKPKAKYDPPADLGHLETTPPELRKQIDEWIVLMLDPQAGRDSLDAKSKLAATGKPAFLPVLGAMAKVRDTIADTDSMEERLIESSLKLADEALREMDGYLDAHDKAPIRPGTEKNYIEYVLRIHYRRWLDGMGSTPLKDMETMPGPFDPSTMQKEEGGDEE